MQAAELERRLAFATDLAREMGREALARQPAQRAATSFKGHQDYLTEVDGAIERRIRAALAGAFPDDDFLGEEDGGGKGGSLWVVDPIDGTANYARGIAHYCVSIGVVRDAEPVVGALHDPSHDRLYWAARGAGAWLAERGTTRRLAVSPIDALTAATVECGWSLRRPQADYVALVDRMLTAGCAIRRAGSGALGLADVAAGRTEGYAELHINSWDCAAGLLLVTEAGGRINDFFAGGGLLAGNPILATNAALADPLAALACVPLRHDA